jgi:uncharacterized membrane protein
MNQRHVNWLNEQLPTLVAEGIVPPEVAAGLRDYYGGARASGRRLVVTAFAILGAILIGGGIILLLAYNWDELARGARTVLSFAPLVLAQAVAGWVLWNRNDSVAWREGAGTFLTLAIGSSIALVSQTYNLPGTFGTFMLTWVLLTLPVIYVLRASAPAMLYFAGVTAWACDVKWEGGTALWFWPLTAAAVPYLWFLATTGWQQPRLAWPCWVLAVCVCIGTGFTLDDAALLKEGWILIYAGLFGLLYLAGNRWAGDASSMWQRPFQTVGALGVILLSLTLTFEWPWEFALQHVRKMTLGVENVIAATIPIAAVALWVNSLRGRAPAQIAFGAVPLVAGFGYILWSRAGAVPATILFNLYLLALGVAVLAGGIREYRLGAVNAGMALLALLIITRFFDSNLGLVARGLAFIAVGVGFLVANMILLRRKEAVAR